MRPRRWSDLPEGLVRQIAGSLHVASDFVRFHAACKPWRRSHKSTSASKKTADQFLPWLLLPNEPDHESLKLRCVFSKCGYVAPGPPPPPPSYLIGWNWVGSADGTAVCYLSSDSPRGPTLHDALTGAALRELPPFLDGQWEVLENPRGIIYKDGTVLLYSTLYGARSYTAAVVTAALLRPGEDAWTVIQRTLESPNHREVCVAYHAGKILVTVQRDLWHVVPLTRTPAAAANDMLVRSPPSMPPSFDDLLYYDEHDHVLESRGELLWALVHMSLEFPEECRERVQDIVAVVSVTVHALEEDNAASPRWVRKEGKDLADRVLFLGWPNSFAVDAAKLGVDGGFAYYMYDVGDEIQGRRGVFKYDLINKRTEFVDWLPNGWDGAMCTWLIPQPIIPPIRQD